MADENTNTNPNAGSPESTNANGSEGHSSNRYRRADRNVMDDQAQQLYRAQLRRQLNRTQRDVESHFRNIMEQQAQMYSQLNENMSESDRRMLRDRANALNDQLGDELRRYRNQYKSYSKLLTRADKQNFKVVYKNNRDNLRKLEREARYRFEEIDEEGTDAFNNIGESANNLIDIVNAINIDNIADQLGESAQSFVDYKREMKKQLTLSAEDWDTFDSNVSKTVKDLHNKISRSDVASISEQMVDWGVTDVKSLDKYTRAFAKNQLANGLSADSLEGLFSLDFTMGKDGDLIEQFGDALKALTNEGFMISNDSMAEVTTGIASALDTVSGGNDEVTQELIKQFMASSAAANNQSINDLLDPIMQEIASSTTQELGELAQKYGGVDVMGIRNQMNSGDLTGAYVTMAQNLKNGTNNQALLDYLRSNMGMSDSDLSALRRLDVDQLQADISQATSAINNSSGSMDDFISKMSIGVGKEVSNAFGNSLLGQKLSDFLDDTGLDLGDLTITAAAINNLTGGKLSSLGGKVLGGAGNLLKSGAGSLLGKLSGTGIGSLLSNTKIGSSLLSSAGRVSASSLASAFGTSADDIASMFGRAASYSLDDVARVMGTSADDVASLLGSTASNSSGLLSKVGGIASKAAGPLAIAGVALDGILGGFKTKDWFGKENAGVGNTIASVLGGALGGTGPGIADEGSFIEKGLGIGGGALKGAGVGALIGSVIPGLGTAIGGAVGAAIGGVGSAIGGGNIAKALSWTGGKIKDAGSWTVDKLKDAGTWIGDKATDAGNWIGEKFDDAGTWIQEKGTWVSDQIAEFGTTIKDGVTDLWNSFTDAISNIKNWIADKGKKVVEGAKDAGEWVADKASSAGSWVGDKLKGAGNWIGSKLGFADGLSNVPYDNFPALLHKNESVLTAAQTAILKRTTADGGIDVSNLLSTDSTSDLINSTTDNLVKSIMPTNVKESLLATDENSSDILSNLTDYFKQTKKDNKDIITTFKRTGIFGNLTGSAMRGSGSSLLGRLFSGLTGLTGTSSSYGGSSFGISSSASFGGTSGGFTSTGGMSDSGSGLDVLAFHPNLEGTGADRWRAYAVDALQANGLSTSQDMVNKVIKQIGTESSGKPDAINNWDSNAKAGHPSKGLLQTIDSTFSTYKFAGHDDIWNGYDNMLAAINYAKNRYGNTLINAQGNGLGSGHGYAVGTPWIPEDQVAVVHKGEMIVPAKNNPFNTSVSAPVNTGDDNLDSVINVIKWAVNRMEKKTDEVIEAINKSSATSNTKNYPTTDNSYSYSNGPSNTDIAFTF